MRLAIRRLQVFSIQTEKAYTLIGLLFVIAILGILASVAVPNLGKFVESSQIAAANSEAGMVSAAVQAGMADGEIASLTGYGTLSAGLDLTAVGVTADNYIQGGITTLVGTYKINPDGTIDDSTNGTSYAGLPSRTAFVSGIGKWQ